MFFFSPIWVSGLPDVTFAGLSVLDFIDSNFGCGGCAFNLSPFFRDDLINLSCPDFRDMVKSGAFIVLGDNVFSEGVECPDDRFFGNFSLG